MKSLEVEHMREQAPGTGQSGARVDDRAYSAGLGCGGVVNRYGTPVICTDPVDDADSLGLGRLQRRKGTPATSA